MRVLYKNHIRRLSCCILLLAGVILSSMRTASAQDETVTASGIVVDSQGKPIIGATVVVKGSSRGASTGLDGKFSLRTNPKSLITVSFIGYFPQERIASTLKGTTIQLDENTQNVEEIVVVGYGSQKKVTMTGSIAQVSTTELMQSPVPNLGTALAGRAPGLTTYQYSGQPGSDDVVIRIRGNGTLDGNANSAEPLVLVDGVERNFTQLDPNEIESFTVLKDAASTAVFGIRGANGVIVITTKQGGTGAAKVSFTANYALQTPTRLQTNLNAMTYAKRYNQAWKNDGNDIPYFNDVDMQLFESGADPIEHGNRDWKKELIKNVALQQQYNVNVSGGSKDIRYYASIGYMDQGGLMKNFDGKIENRDLSTDFFYKRINVRTNVEVNLTKTTKVGIQIGGVIGNQQQTNNPTQTFQDIVYAAPMMGLFLYEDKLIKPGRYGEDEHKKSPLDFFLTNVFQRKSNEINTNIKFEQKLDFITKGLLLRGMGSYDSNYNQTINTTNPNSKVFYLATSVDPLILEQDGEYGIVSTPGSTYSRRQSIHAEMALEYKGTFNKVHNVSGLFLGTLDKRWWHGKEFNTVPISYMGLVGRFTYDYRSRYLIELNMGYNGSENFPEGKRFALFPAVSVGWNVMEEKFVKNIIGDDIISRLKFRVSYGIVGNDASGSSRFMYRNGSYSAESGIFYMGSTNPKKYGGYKEGILGNPNITWETASKQNYGVDIGLFKDKLKLTAEIFYEDRSDILAKINTDPIHQAISGQDVYNIGRVKNRGYEIEASWRQNIKDFSYFISTSYSFARNTVIEDGSIQDPDNPHLWKRGRSTGLTWIYQADGFFNSKEEIMQGIYSGTPSPGDVRIVDINGDGTIDSEDLFPCAYPEIPEISYTCRLGFSYKNLSVSALFQGAANSTKIMTGYYKTFNLPYPDSENWSEATKDVAVRPKLSLNNSYSGNTTNSTLWTRSGNYLKLRNIEISYTFNKQLIKKAIGIDNLRIFANGQNLYSWDNVKYVDPEMKTNAATTGSYGYPQLRVFNFGLSLNF